MSLSGGSVSYKVGATSGGWPDTTNTGVPAGVSLTASGGLTITTNGTVIDALNISGDVTINANNVTIKRSKITGIIKGDNGSGGTTGIQGTGLLIQDCEIDGGEVNGSTSGPTLVWLGAGTGTSGTIERCNLHHGENAFSVDSGSAVTVKDCYIHAMLRELGSEPQPHTDGFQFAFAASGLNIQHCHLEFPEAATSGINFNNESGATNSNMTVNNCLIRRNAASSFDGYRFAAMFPRFSGWSNIAFTNNVVERGRDINTAGDGGYFDSPENTTTWSGNVDYITGNPI